MSPRLPLAFVHEDLAVPVLERVPDAAPPLAVIVADATRAVGELPSPPIRSAPTVSSEMGCRPLRLRLLATMLH